MVFTIYGHVGHLGHVTWTIYLNFRSPLHMDALHEVWLKLAKQCKRRRSLKLWTTDDGWTPDHGHPINSPCEPSAQVS